MDDRERYLKAAHAMQSGVAFKKDKTDQEPKHLRVGVNVAMSDLSGLALLLIEKGVITEAEYLKSIADAMEREAAGLAEIVSRECGGVKVTLA